ncbi:RNA polymerase, sigma-24 subunit, ECF subfamily [Syntrophobotulus glycolicus DSM 8271]|uniref:RNA polymerase, sigma-24 subunit, ECF subfamily n=1 Tax=Syntrophobotulus glycolicus (strain DSM 8271 / FlGlyR) TaxID=645991 RepID=F0SVV7_SYNGF|nr:RNA polymerase sigma factor [Syntrophobotulus glycolicus]ADY55663.1 RNA polymerase, sigma-24 subunit, ECF subfamily [Syntrophobotulus glycolicus DSM 8271]
MERDQKWIQEILRRGSQQAADQLVRSYYDEIYIFIYRQVGNREDARDLTQDSFIAALRSLPSYDEKKAGFRTWLYRLATYKVIDAKRKRKPVAVPLDEDKIFPAEDFVTKIMDKALLQQIEEYVRALDPTLQEVFRLRLYGDYSFPEIASATAEPEAKIKARYYRLLHHLRKEFNNDAQI